MVEKPHELQTIQSVSVWRIDFIPLMHLASKPLCRNRGWFFVKHSNLSNSSTLTLFYFSIYTSIYPFDLIRSFIFSHGFYFFIFNRLIFFSLFHFFYQFHGYIFHVVINQTYIYIACQPKTKREPMISFIFFCFFYFY